MRSFVLCLGLLVATRLLATPLDWSYPELTLKNGQVLRAVVLQSYDSTTGSVVLCHEGQTLTLPLAQLPDGPATRVRRLAADTTPAPAPTPLPVALKPSPTNPVPLKLSPEQQAAMDQVLDALLRAQARRVATEKADAFFRLESLVSTGAAKVTGLRILTAEPAPVAGQRNRYRTLGQARFEYLDAQGHSLGCHTRTFEVITGLDQNSQTLVIEFTTK